MKAKTIWIDICHPPQAVFYIPIMQRIRRLGYPILITVQHNQESFGLLERAGLPYRAVGRKYGRNLFAKALGLLTRCFQLWRIVRTCRIWIGVSQGSPYQIIVCRLLHIPVVVTGDNEHTDWFFVKLSQKAILPEAIPERSLKMPIHRIVRFPGLKEEVYLSGFKPDLRFRAVLKRRSHEVRVLVRSPATFAQYHQSQTSQLFERLMERLLSYPNVQVVFLARSKTEARSVREKHHAAHSRLIIPDKVIDGLNLIWHSDAVFSGGGTMTREAALLGVPAYSYFQGLCLAVDQYLVKRGKLKWIRNEQDIQHLVLKRRSRSQKIPENRGLLDLIVREILSVRTDAGTRLP